MSDASDVDLELSSFAGDDVYVDTDSVDGESNTEADTALGFSNRLAAEEDHLGKARTIQEKLKDAVEDVEKCHDGQVRHLLAQGAYVSHQYEENLLKTPLHILCSSFGFVDRRKDTSRRFTAIARVLLDAGADVNILDYYANTVLHVAAENGVPEKTMKEIIKRSTDVNQLNDNGETALHNLFQCSGCVTREKLEAFIDAGANLEMKIGFDRHSQSLMQIMAGKGNCVSLISLIDQKKPGLIDRHVCSMLDPAVRHGTSDTVKVLLDRGASVDVNVRGEPLIHLAASSPQDALKKFDLFLANGHYIHAVDSKGETVLHKAALSDNVDVMKKALDKKVDRSLASYNKALPIHHCAGRDGSKCLKLLVKVGSDLHARTIDGESPLYLAVRSKAKDNIAVLIQAGCSVRANKLKYLGFEKISALAEPEVIIASPAPATFALELTELLKKIAARNESHGQRLLEMIEDMEQLAVDIMEGSGSDADDVLTDDLIFYALENNLKKFIASAAVQERMRGSWYGKKDESALEMREYPGKLGIYLLKMLFLPLFMVIMLPRRGCYYKQFADQFLECDVEPVIAYIANAISYVIFLALLIAKVIHNNQETRCDNLEDGTGCGMDALDWIVFIFVLGLIAQEVGQFRNIEFTEYFSSFSNIFDLILMFLFIVCYLFAMIGFYSHLDIDVRYQLVRASYHVLGFAVLISCIRFLSYLQAHSVLGPIQLSFVGITSDVVLFLIILGTFLVGFAVSVTSIQTASKYSPGKLAHASGAYHVDNAWMSLKTMFWALFGLTDATSFKHGSDSEDAAEVVVSTALFALWLIIAMIVLLNMLIALISHSLLKVKDNADIEWKFARAMIIRDTKKAPPIPVPMNLFHVFAQIVSHLCCRHCSHCQVDEPSEVSSNRSMIQQASKQMVKNFKEKIAKERSEKPVTKADLKKFRSRIDRRFRTLLNAIKNSSMRKFASRETIFSTVESDSEEEAYTSFFRHHLKRSHRRHKSPATKENANESKEPEEANTCTLHADKKFFRYKTLMTEESTCTTAREEVRIEVETVSKTSCDEMEDNLSRELHRLKTDVEARLDAVVIARLDDK